MISKPLVVSAIVVSSVLLTPLAFVQAQNSKPTGDKDVTRIISSSDCKGPDAPKLTEEVTSINSDALQFKQYIRRLFKDKEFTTTAKLRKYCNVHIRFQRRNQLYRKYINSVEAWYKQLVEQGKTEKSESIKISFDNMRESANQAEAERDNIRALLLQHVNGQRIVTFDQVSAHYAPMHTAQKNLRLSLRNMIDMLKRKENPDIPPPTPFPPDLGPGRGTPEG